MTLHSGPGIGEMLSGACHRCRARSGPACGLDPTLARMDCAHFNPGAAASEPVREMAATFAPIEDIVGTRPTKAETLDAAKAAVADRGLNYGTPEDNFARIAALWQTHLVNRYGGEHKIDPHDVAQMMVLMKVARLENDPGHLDSWTDVAGYAACGANLPVSAR